MPLRLGPGPVFIHESIAATRRWQLYALRSFFVLMLLGGLAIVWMSVQSQYGQAGGSLSIQGLAQLGEEFYIAIASVQLVLVLIVAPAATAATICQDRARGTLTHMLVTDLTSSEIVLGKLAARLTPVLALVAATVPVLALAGLLGGVVIEAIVTLTLITLVLAVFGCTLALAFSVRASKTHEVLMAVYGIEAVWVLGALVWSLLEETGDIPPMPDWLWNINPFTLAYAPYLWPNAVSLDVLATVLGVVLALSVGLTAYAVLRLRADLTDRAGSRINRLSACFRWIHRRFLAWRPCPSLDDNPVLWREWRRGWPSRLARVVWGVFIVASLAGTAWGFYMFTISNHSDPEFLSYVGGMQATFGLLLLSLSAPTLMAEERVRGSLDVLMTTPLSTDRIVTAKWLGAYRVVPALALLPAIGALVIALSKPELTNGYVRFGQTPSPWTTIDRLACTCLPLASLLVQGAAVTSIGVALATWFRRLGRAVAVSVASYILYTFVLVCCLELVPELMTKTGLISQNDNIAQGFTILLVATAIPFGSQIASPELLALPPSESRLAFYIGQVIVILLIMAFALVVLALTLVTFDRCMGRAPERPRRAPAPACSGNRTAATSLLDRGPSA